MFIQPCYIRRNTPRLIRELERLGYQKFAKLSNTPDSIYCWDSFYATKDYADCISSAATVKEDLGITVIDCGENEEAFLALAALSDDREIYQKYVIDEDGEYYPDYEATSDAYPVFFSQGDIVDYDDEALVHCRHHKASKWEIMEYYGIK